MPGFNALFLICIYLLSIHLIIHLHFYSIFIPFLFCYNILTLFSQPHTTLESRPVESRICRGVSIVFHCMQFAQDDMNMHYIKH